MQIPIHILRKKSTGNSQPEDSAIAATVHKLAFDNSAQANIIFTVKTGKILIANAAACHLLGYSEKEISEKNRSDIFVEGDFSFKKMLVKRNIEGHVIAKVTAILKSGKFFPCEISSAIFKNVDGIKTSITTITDIRAAIATQKKKDNKIKKVTDDNILKAQLKTETDLTQIGEWLKYFAETSYDVMWEWNIVTGKIYVGNSIEDVFGYKVKDDTIYYETFLTFLDPAQKDFARKKMVKILSSQKTLWEDTFLIRRKGGTMASTTSRACILRDGDGLAIKLIGATQDVSKLLELEKKLSEQDLLYKEDSKKFMLAAKLSFDVIWDWNLIKNELFIGEGFRELFGYRINKNKGNMARDWVQYIHPDDKELITQELKNTLKSKATQWKHAYRILRADGTIAKVYARANIMRDETGKAYRMIGAVQDLSRQKDLEDRLDIEVKNNTHLLAAYKENFRLIFNSSTDILYDADLVSGTVVLSDAFESVLGYKVNDNTITIEEWMSHIHPDDKPSLFEGYRTMLAARDFEWKYSCRYLKPDNSSVMVQGNSIVLRSYDGVGYRLIGAMQVGEKNMKLKEKLISEINSNERKMKFALEEARIAERSEIGKELHDNVNQLLGASKLYLEMAKKGGKDTEMFLNRSSEYTLSAIEEIRKLTKGLTTDTIGILGICGSIEKMASDIMEVQPLKFTLRLDISVEQIISNKIKLNLFRIVQEQFNNILKHANASVVIVSLSSEDNIIRLIITDNGEGFDVLKVRQGIGMANIIERVAVLKGTSKTVSRIDTGTTFILKFPIGNINNNIETC